MSYDNHKGTFFYGYIVVAAAFAIMAVSSGAIYSFSVFFAPLQDEFGWSRALTSGAFSSYVVVHGLLSIGTGRLNDRFGPRAILSACSLFFGLGFILMSQIHSVLHLYLLYGVMIAAGFSGAPVPLMSTVARWFRARRGMMTGVVMSGSGFGTMFVPPLANALIHTLEWRTAFAVVGGLVLVVVLVAAQFLKREPAQLGLKPLGGDGADDASSSPNAPIELTFATATRTKQLGLLVVAFAGFGFALQSVMVHVVVNAIGHGLSPSSAAGIMTAIGGMGVVGRVGVGMLADRFGSKRLLAFQFLLLATSLFWVAVATDGWAIFAFGFAFGFAYGGIVPLYSHIVAELFGLRAHGAILGTITFSVGIGSAIGPIFTGYCYDLFGSYLVPFVTCGVVAAGAALMTSLVRPLSPASSDVVCQSHTGTCSRP
jgi:MFS family permease